MRLLLVVAALLVAGCGSPLAPPGAPAPAAPAPQVFGACEEHSFNGLIPATPVSSALPDGFALAEPVAGFGSQMAAAIFEIMSCADNESIAFVAVFVEPPAELVANESGPHAVLFGVAASSKVTAEALAAWGMPASAGAFTLAQGPGQASAVSAPTLGFDLYVETFASAPGGEHFVRAFGVADRAVTGILDADWTAVDGTSGEANLANVVGVDVGPAGRVAGLGFFAAGEDERLRWAPAPLTS